MRVRNGALQQSMTGNHITAAITICRRKNQLQDQLFEGVVHGLLFGDALHGFGKHAGNRHLLNLVNL